MKMNHPTQLRLATRVRRPVLIALALFAVPAFPASSLADDPVPNGGNAADASYVRPYWSANVTSFLSTAFSSVKTSRIRGALVNPSGQPITNAELAVDRLPSAVGAVATRVNTLRTDSKGHFTYDVPKAPGSARITISYQAFSGPGVVSQPVSSTLTLVVKAATSLSAPRKVKANKTFKISGELLGKGGAASGSVVLTQLRFKRKWVTVATRNVAPNRKWGFNYKFPKGSSGKTSIRAIVIPGSGYPFARATGKSKPLLVKIK